MSITLDLPEDLERRLRALGAEHGSIETAIVKLLAESQPNGAEQAEPASATPSANGEKPRLVQNGRGEWVTVEEWQRQFREHCDSAPNVGGVIPFDRASCYPEIEL